MTAADERILDLALEEELGGKRPPDLTLRILSAVRAAAEAAPAEGPADRRRPAWRVWLAAAVVVLAAGAALFFGRGEPVVEPPVVVAESATDLLAMVDGEERRLRTFHGGETIVVPGKDAATITLSSGPTLEVEGPAALVLGASDEAVSAELLAGRVRVRTEEESTRVRSGAAGDVEVSPDSDLLVEAIVDPWLEEEGRVASLTSPGVDRTVVLEVETGGAALVGEKPGPAIDTEEHLVCWADGEREVAPLPAASVRKFMHAMFEKGRLSSADIDEKGRDYVLKVKGAQAAADTIARQVVGDPLLWSWVRPHLHELPRTEARNDVARRFLQVLLADDHPRTRALFVAVLETNPGVIDTNSLLLLAERGLEEAEKRLAAILTEPRAPELPANVFPALYFAVRGDDRGRAVLETQFDNEGLSGWNRPAACGAAVGLARLGDREIWGVFVDRLEREVEAHLATDNLAAAKTAVLTAAYFHRMLGVSGPVPISFTRTRTLRWQEAYGEGIDDADGVRAWLQTLREAPR